MTTQTKSKASNPLHSVNHRGCEIKNLKNFTGREGYGFSASLYMDGKKVGTVTNSADGGCYHYSLKRDDYSRLNEIAKEELGANEFEVCDSFVMRLANDKEMETIIKRTCKNNTAWKVKGQKEGEFFKQLIPYSPAIGESLRNKYDDLEVIYNELFV